MDVINLSLGEPEIEPTRDIVVAAIDNAAAAGVVPVIAAGNEFADAGKGSVGSPGNRAEGDHRRGVDGRRHRPRRHDRRLLLGRADADLAADEAGRHRTRRRHPLVAAAEPVVGSRLERHEHGVTARRGRGRAAQRAAPAWTVEQIKSALESTGDPVHPAGSAAEVSVLREGGGRIDIPRADNPLVFTDPTGISFGLVKRGVTATRTLALADAGGGAAPWTATVAPQATLNGVTLSLSSALVAAGSALTITLNVAADAAEGDADGFVLLTRGTDVRRVPYWLHVEVPQARQRAARDAQAPGLYGGNTAGKRSLVSSYRYPEGGLGRAGRPLGPGAGLPDHRREAGREPRRRRAHARQGRRA